MMEKKTGDIFLTEESGRFTVYFRSINDEPAAFLCAADSQICSAHPHLRELLFELAAELAVNRERAPRDSIALRVREPLAKSTAVATPVIPCSSCTAPQAADVRAWAASCSAEDVERQLSPAGWPPGCCHVQPVGQFGSQAARVGR